MDTRLRSLGIRLTAANAIGRCLVGCLALVFCSASLAGAAMPPQLILTDASGSEELRGLVRVLEENGASVRHFFPPDGALGTVPLDLDPEAIPELADRVVVLGAPEAPEPLRREGMILAERRLGGIWRELHRLRPEGAGGSFGPDALEPEQDWPQEELGLDAGPLPCSLPGWSSEYLLGDVSLGILIMESVSASPAENTEDWSEARQDEVVAEIVEAADQLASIYPDAGLDFFYDVQRDLPSEVEPIIHDSGARDVWISDAMVGDIPPGASDNSSPTGGEFGSGTIQIDDISLEPGAAGVVQFKVNALAGTSNTPMLRNRARVTGLSASGELLDVTADDPSTHAAYDSTDLMRPQLWPSVAITVFWNQDVDLDIRVVDPCGNAVGPADWSSAQCPPNEPGISLGMAGGCGDAWPWGWVESVGYWVTDVLPSAGTYEVWLRYTASRDDPGSGCRHGGLEDAVVLVEMLGAWTYRWMVLDPAETDWVRVTSLEVP